MPQTFTYVCWLDVASDTRQARLLAGTVLGQWGWKILEPPSSSVDATGYTATKDEQSARADAETWARSEGFRIPTGSAGVWLCPAPGPIPSKPHSI